MKPKKNNGFIPFKKKTNMNELLTNSRLIWYIYKHGMWKNENASRDGNELKWDQSEHTVDEWAQLNGREDACVWDWMNDK